MHCINCGDKISDNEKFCTACGKKVEVEQKLNSSKIAWHWKTFILTAIIASLVWFFYYFGFVNKNTESANVIGHLLETVGRQKQAWTKSEKIIELFGTGLSDDCLYTVGCVDEVVTQVTTLRAEIDKENLEINNLWTEEGMLKDFEIFFSSLDESDQSKLNDILNIYFPDEKVDVNTKNILL